MDNTASTSGYVECGKDGCNALFDPISNGYDKRTLRRYNRTNSKFFCPVHKPLNDKLET